MPGKGKLGPGIEYLGDGKYRIRWQFKDANGKWRYRQRDITGSDKDAERELNRIKYELQQNKYIDKSRMTVKEQVEECFDFHQYELSEKARARYEQNIRLHIIPGVGNIQLSKFCVKDIQEFYKSKRTGGRMDGKPTPPCFISCILVAEKLGHEDEAFTVKAYHHVLPRFEDEAVAMYDDILTGKILAPDPKQNKPSEDECVKTCVINNAIALPTGAPPKKKTRNSLRDKVFSWS